jgi:hypothetical protein
VKCISLTEVGKECPRRKLSEHFEEQSLQLSLAGIKRRKNSIPGEMESSSEQKESISDKS